MNQFTPEWDPHPPQYTCPDPLCRAPGTCMRKTNERGYHAAPVGGRPDDYRPESAGPYTPPPTPPEQSKPPRYAWGTFITVAVLLVLFIIGLAVSASRDDTVVPVPNSGTASTTPAPARFTPQAHKPYKPAAPAPTGLNAGGLLIVGIDVQPGVYRSTVVPRYLAGREDSGYCYVTRLNTTTPSLGAVRTPYDYAPTGPIIANASYRETGQTVTLKILPTDKAVEIFCGDAVWKRVA
jgi:hypothetical protein